MYGIHLVSVDILVYIGEILEFLGKSSIFFSDLTSIYCEIREILIICHFLVSSSLVCVQVGSDFRSQREGSLFCICFLGTNWCSFTSFILHFTFIWYLNSPIACLSIDLIQSQTCCSWFGFPVYIINPQYFCVNLQIFVNIVRISSLNIVKSSDLLDCYPFIVWFFQY